MLINYHDTINLLSKLTNKRIWNFVKLLVSFFVSKAIGKPLIWGKPVSITIEPTTSCNLRCPQCISGLRDFTRPTGMLNFELFAKILDETEEELVWLILYFQGEPFLNKDFLKFVEYANQKKIYTATSSNAHYFTDEVAKQTIQSGLSRLIISIDGTTQETYSKYRIGGDLDKVIEGTKKLLDWKRELKMQHPYIIWQFIVFKHNEHQLPEVKRMAKELGVELGIKTAQIYDYQTSDAFIPSNEDLSRYHKTEAGAYEIKGSLLNQCWRMWRATVVTWNGQIVPCCFDKDAKQTIGNTLNTGVYQIWHSQPYQQFRQSILKSRKEIDMCKNCSEGVSVWK